ncbi:DUF4862 family protein [Paraglaciecola aquimarina]|uniref:DUF4862 family protein n=1 Tax=Paraglaciecola aquimarina TaxID=1235557 RepID=A0ABU3T030_9ALTE|nr:DUF4862 family protein [Paraglaciecola aquimarina]MDU0355618.1 DUF4862 family protein [Paraglaciecola aquimarina]
MQYFVGAYATSPNVSSWDPDLETNYYQQLKARPNIKGLEHPFVGKLHAHDDEWFLTNIDPNWQFLFTCVPGNMGALAKDPNFGIASDDEAGRGKALEFMQKACNAVGQLNAHLGRQAVQAVEIQTAPNRSHASGSSAALKKSLDIMLQWDWQGAQLVIEHCDTLVEGQKPAKGFLSIKDEIAVVKAVNAERAANIGMVVNWGRSVIEARSVGAANQHIELLKSEGLLAGLMFSGVSDQNTEYGAWSDSHMPPAPNEKLMAGAVGSLMTEKEMISSLAASDAENLSIVGIKLGIRPRDMSLDDRVNHISDCLAALERYAK